MSRQRSSFDYRMQGLGRTGLGQTFDEILGFGPAMGDAIRLFFHSTSSYLALVVALKEKGWLSYLGWFLGIGQGVGAICDTISLAKRAMGIHPSENPVPICNALTPPPALPMSEPRLPVDNLPGTVRP